MDVLAFGDTVSQNGRAGQWDKLPKLFNYSVLRMRESCVLFWVTRRQETYP